MSPHEVVYGHKLRAPIDLIPMSPLQRASESAESFACRMSDLHKSISNQITLSNEKYKALADIHRRYKRFYVGNFVMIRLRPERSPPGTFRKLQARGMGPFEVFSKVGENGYIIDIPSDWGIYRRMSCCSWCGFSSFSRLPHSSYSAHHSVAPSVLISASGRLFGLRR